MELHYGGETTEEDTTSVARGISPADGLPIDILDEMRSQTLIINELLRHFWASYPVNTYAKATRLTRVKDALASHFERSRTCYLIDPLLILV